MSKELKKSNYAVETAEHIEQSIRIIRGQKVLFDRDLAELYGVETKRLKEQVRRNIDRFPADFMFVLTKDELSNWRSQTATSNSDRMGLRHSPMVFTEQGVAMLSGVLKSVRAVKVNIAIMRTFVKLRRMLEGNRQLADNLAEIESKYDEQFRVVFEVLNKLISPPEPKRKKIGFCVKESNVEYIADKCKKVMDSMQEKVDKILVRMDQACVRSGRGVDEVRLIAVSKKYPPERVCEAIECGLSVFGESRVPEAEAKIAMCPGGVEWELIGHLQRNKVNRAARLFNMIHAVDSIALLNKINSASKECGKTMRVCLEVNVSGESSKYGFRADEIPEVLEVATTLMSVDVVGLMTIPPFTPNAEDARPYFSKLRELRDEVAELSGFGLEELSMGMSGDFEVAIEEGATCVRVGTAIFGIRD